MDILRRLVDWFLFSALFLACCALGLCMATERLINSYVPPLITSLHVFIFGSTLIVYNVHYLIKKSTPQRSDLFRWSQKNRGWQYFFLFAGLVLCIGSLWWLPGHVIGACIFLGALAFGYSIPFLPFKNKKRLRDFGWIKITVLGIVWTIVTAILPIIYWGYSLSDFPYEILIRFVFLFTLCVAFDIRDMQTDLEANIYTLPNLIGVKNSYRLMNATLVLFALLSIVQYVRYPIIEKLVGALLTAAITKWVIYYTKKHPSDRAYLALVDGIMFLYAMLVLLH